MLGRGSMHIAAPSETMHAFPINHLVALDVRATPSSLMRSAVLNAQSAVVSKYASGALHNIKNKMVGSTSLSKKAVKTNVRKPPQKGRIDRREYRRQAERQRRDLLKDSFDALKTIVAVPGKQVSRDRVLDAAVVLIRGLQNEEKEKEGHVDALEWELRELRIQVGAQ
ncbi:UNVERIFIED_CONTAM: hypothetical protein HDU68_009670 [Siphonaria sp. JEL0065]|nr:hypothetical protein HDU68_009670 [Siphonaria sp. JEL0065]